MPPDRIKEATGHTTDELLAMAHEIVDPAADLAGKTAEELEAPAGAVVVTFFALDMCDEEESRFGVLPVRSVWTFSGVDDDRRAPLESHSERAWAQNVLANATARRMEEHERLAYLRETAQALAQLADRWGYELVGLDTDPVPARRRESRTTRPTGPGGRQRKRRRR